MVKIFTMVKGEVDIVEDWVLYHGSIFGFKNIFVIDNYSLDGTYEKLIDLQNKFGIKVFRLPDYKKKGQYMTIFIRKFCNRELGIPIDIDEFIVYFDKITNNISCNRNLINNYLSSLPEYPVFKMNYINSKLIKYNEKTEGYNRATIESHNGSYNDGGTFAKSFFWSHLFKETIDHGNHFQTKNYILTNLCLIHFHTRNLEQIKKKVYNNVKGLGHNPFDIHNLKQRLMENSVCEGCHHLNKQIDILSGTFNLPYEEQKEDDIMLTPFNNYIMKITNQ
jgi:hypothetical protein